MVSLAFSAYCETRALSKVFSITNLVCLRLVFTSDGVGIGIGVGVVVGVIRELMT